MSSPLDHLDIIFKTRRAPTQRKVLLSLLAGQITARGVARATGLSENAVHISLSELKARGIVEVPIRGRFYPSMTLIALSLSGCIEALEQRIIKKKGARNAAAQAPGSTSRTAPQPTPEGDLL